MRYFTCIIYAPYDLYTTLIVDAPHIVPLLGIPVQLPAKLSSFMTKPADEKPGERFHPIIRVDTGNFFDGEFSIVAESTSVCITKCLISAFKCLFAT